MSRSSSARRRTGAIVIAVGTVGLLIAATSVEAAIVPTVTLGTASRYSVLGGQTVTNTGSSTLHGSLGVSPGTAIVGFPPGQVVAPGTTDAGNAVAGQAQSDLTAAYVSAAGRSLTKTTAADLSGVTLVGGVYAGPSKSPLGLTGTVTLDGQGDPRSVFIFQTDSTLITGSGSRVALINGAQQCNVFWQVGSSATLGSGSNFTGTIMALTSITVTSGVTVHGRALARNGAVTLDNDTFTLPTCDLGASTASTVAPSATVPGGGTVPGTGGGSGGGGGRGTVPGGGTATQIPRTGTQTNVTVAIAVAFLILGAGGVVLARRRMLPHG
jgi:LPXTG-motif cell wall-anchored protein